MGTVRTAQRITAAVLPCGTQVVAYRLKGARTTCVLLRTGSWDTVFKETAPEWMTPFKEASGHLIEHGVCGTMAGTDTEGLRGLWRGGSVEWVMEGTPGETRRMVGTLARAFEAGASLSQDVLAAEWSPRAARRAASPGKGDRHQCVQHGAAATRRSPSSRGCLRRRP